MNAQQRVIARQDLRRLLADPGLVVVLILMPLLLTAFLRPMVRTALEQEGYAGVTGTEHAVPGTAMMFSFFLVTWAAYSIFMEHSWNTWDRLRTSPAQPADIMVGKVTPLVLVGVTQQVALFVLGWLLFDLRIEGSVLALPLVAVPFVTTLVALGIALAAMVTNLQYAASFGNLSSILLGGLGGALTPASVLPDWLRVLGPLTPGYWAMRGYRSIVLDGEGFGAVLLPSGVLVLMAGLLGLLASWRLEWDKQKIGGWP